MADGNVKEKVSDNLLTLGEQLTSMNYKQTIALLDSLGFLRP